MNYFFGLEGLRSFPVIFICEFLRASGGRALSSWRRNFVVEGFD